MGNTRSFWNVDGYRLNIGETKLKKLFIFLAIMFIAAPAMAWTITWDDTVGEDSYRLSYKDYPAGYAFPGNPAPESLVKDMTGAITVTLPAVTLPADTVSYTLDPANFTPGNRYVFSVQAVKDGSVSGYSDYPCWTWPIDSNVVELPLDSCGNIQINIYQAPR